ncbi:uncharacterized protein METZ01_LOCUS239074 [marine metagenome]|uniref:Uncharacterized protein n=1 Tax=marine metagenome TaxID=408172 RepID=A0A382HFZ9_9ZZZZ
MNNYQILKNGEKPHEMDAAMEIRNKFFSFP